MRRIDPIEFKKSLETRTRAFAVSVFRYLDALPKKNSTHVIAYQLGKAGSSIGANYREANHAESGDGFYHKLAIATKESSEACYWLEILHEIYPTHETPEKLLSECRQLLALLQSIGKSTKRNPKARRGVHSSVNAE